MLRRKFMQNALSGLAALGISKVVQLPDEVEDVTLNIETNTELDLYSDDSIVSFKSKDAGSLTKPGELPEGSTYGTLTKHRIAGRDELFTITDNERTRFIVDMDGNVHFPPFEVQ